MAEPGIAGNRRVGVTPRIPCVFLSALERGATEGSEPPKMSHIHVERIVDATGLESDLAEAERVALDCEAAGFHRYSDRLCLVQITVGDRTYVLDPLAFEIGRAHV